MSKQRWHLVTHFIQKDTTVVWGKLYSTVSVNRAAAAANLLLWVDLLNKVVAVDAPPPSNLDDFYWNPVLLINSVDQFFLQQLAAEESEWLPQTPRNKFASCTACVSSKCPGCVMQPCSSAAVVWGAGVLSTFSTLLQGIVTVERTRQRMAVGESLRWLWLWKEKKVVLRLEHHPHTSQPICALFSTRWTIWIQQGRKQQVFALLMKSEISKIKLTGHIQQQKHACWWKIE